MADGCVEGGGGWRMGVCRVARGSIAHRSILGRPLLRLGGLPMALVLLRVSIPISVSVQSYIGINPGVLDFVD